MRKKMLALLLCGIMAASPVPVLAGSKKTQNRNNRKIPKRVKRIRKIKRIRKAKRKRLKPVLISLMI